VLIVTPVPGTYQCAEIERIALGLRVCAPMRRQASVYPLVMTAFMGLPCPKKIAGISSGTSFLHRHCFVTAGETRDHETNILRYRQ
jgi:hypothetical protein